MAYNGQGPPNRPTASVLTSGTVPETLPLTEARQAAAGCAEGRLRRPEPEAQCYMPSLPPAVSNPLRRALQGSPSKRP